MKRSCQRATHRFRRAGPAHDLVGAQPFGRKQHNLSLPDMLLRRGSILQNRFNRLRSEGFTVMDIPVRMLQIRMPTPDWESSEGLKCQAPSTSSMTLD